MGYSTFFAKRGLRKGHVFIIVRRGHASLLTTTLASSSLGLVAVPPRRFGLLTKTCSGLQVLTQCVQTHCFLGKNEKTPGRRLFILCPGEDLNLHSRSHIHLKDACIPISPPGLGIRAHKMSWPAYYSGPAHFSQLLALMQLPRPSSPPLKLPLLPLLPPRSQLLPQLPLEPRLRLLESLLR